MLVKYCNANCQRNHWPKHKTTCKERAAELHDEALFKDPPAMEDCPICFLPMLSLLVCSVSLPPATISSVPIYDFATANAALAQLDTEQYYECCGKSICGGCVHSFRESGNIGTCAFCKAERMITDKERVKEMMKRVEANDAGAMSFMGSYYYHGSVSLLQDQKKAMELWKQAGALGSSHAHFCIGNEYRREGDLKKAKFHYEAAAMAGHEVARYNLGFTEYTSGKKERAVKHLMIAASAGCFHSMHILQVVFRNGVVSRELIDSTLKAYNNSCAEMRSQARDAYIKNVIHRNM
jgi:TPR repeat protein